MVAVQALERENDALKARLETLEHIVNGEVAGR
jgi:hypothetical protein